MTYYPVFQNVKKVLAELHYFLTPDHLFRAMLAKVDTKGRSRPCRGETFL